MQLILTSLSYFYESSGDDRVTSDESHIHMQTFIS